MADRTIKIVLDASVTGLVNGFKTASTAAQDFGNKLSDGISKNEQHINTLSNTLGGIGLGMTAGFGLAVKTFMDFDQAMSNVAATGEDARGSITALREAAIQAGADTSFSATEAAGAIEELAKAGLSASDILNGGLNGALDLAAAGGLSVADAAQYASTAMAQFGLSGKDVTHIADLLAAGAGKANGEVSDMGAALNQAGLVASQTGLSIEETTGSLAAFAQAGLMGSDAGTSLKTMLQRLSAPSGEAATLMEELGISAYDASGNFVGMASFAGQLTDALGDMTPAQRNAAMATIFGADAVRAAGVIYQNGEAGIRDWITAVDDQGYAAETAAMKLDNLRGDLEGLGGSLETAFINGGTAANELLRGIVQGADGVVDAIGQLPAPILNATALLAGTGGLAALGVSGLAKLTIGLNNARVAANALGISTKAASLAAGGVGVAITAATAGLTAWAMKAAEARARTNEYKDTLDELGNATDKTVQKFNTDLVEASTSWMSGSRDLIGVSQELGLSFEDLQGYVQGNAEAIAKVQEASAAYVSEGNLFEKAVGTRGQLMNDFTGFLDENARAINNGKTETELAAAADSAAGVAKSEYGASTQAATTAVYGFTMSLEDSIQTQLDAANVILGLRDAERGFEAAVDAAEAALQENGATLDTTTEKGRANEAALDGIAGANTRVVAEMQKNGRTQADIQGAVQRSRDEFLRLAGSMGMSASDAARLADQLGLIPGNYTATVVANTDPATSRIQEFIRNNNGHRVSIFFDAVQGTQINTVGHNMRAYDSGGYTGDGGRFEAAGIVHKGEFVADQDMTRKYRPMLEDMHAGRDLGRYMNVYTAPATYVNAGASSSSRVMNFNSTVYADGQVAAKIADEIAHKNTAKMRDMAALYGIGGS